MSATEEKASARKGAQAKSSGGDAAARIADESTTLAYKADPSAPESHIVYAPAVASAATEDPEPKEVQIDEGETPAQYEAHVWVNSPAKITERLEREADENKEAYEIARQQHVDAVETETGLIEVAEPTEESKAKRQAAAERQETVQALASALISGTPASEKKTGEKKS